MGLSKMQKKFADEYVFLYFHCKAMSREKEKDAFCAAGYKLTGDRTKDEKAIEELMKDAAVKEYIDGQLEHFRKVLSDDQAKGLWKHISLYELKDNAAPEYGSGTIYLH